MSNNTLFSFSDPYIHTYNEGQDMPFDFFLSNDLTNDNYLNSYDPSLGNDVNFNQLTEESTQLIQEQVNAEDVMQVVHKQHGDEECEYDDEESEYANEINDNKSDSKQ
ncbi:hypothetical protein F8M41_010883 [Gigaspora margarita]|uniref:Uncharacterized protein n=1 Tax=Gigaspora margarita TaxID=4874 RepID=A0A8H3X125_GIGMA|nr:hypothetical protein F8M41_010883 [Gigaspora margarita]